MKGSSQESIRRLVMLLEKFLHHGYPRIPGSCLIRPLASLKTASKERYSPQVTDVEGEPSLTTLIRREKEDAHTTYYARLLDALVRAGGRDCPLVAG